MKRLFLPLLLLFCLSLFAEETITQDKAYINRNFKVYVKTMVPYSRDLEVELPLEEYGAMSVAGEPYLRPYNALVENSGEIIYEEMTEAVLTFRASAGDIYQCSGLRFFREKFEMVLPDFPVIVHNRDESNLDFPLQVYWSPVKDQAYPGEIISLILNVRYTESLDFPEEIHMAKPAVGDLDQVDLSGDIETFEIRDKTIYSYPLESWYFSSGESGHLTIPGGSVSILGLNRDIPSLELDILPPPEEIMKSGAVGDFSVVTQFSGNQAAQGEILTLSVRIEGTGNFHYMSFPEIVADGFELINSDESEELIPTESGYSGYRQISYRYQAGGENRGKIVCTPFSWMNPVTGKIETFSGNTYDVDITVQSGEESQRLPLLSSFDITRLICKEKFDSPFKWLFILPGLIYFLFVLFSLNERKSDWLPLLIVLPLLLSFGNGPERRESVEKAQELFRDGDLRQSLALYEALYEKEGYAAYLYNRAVLEFYQGNLTGSEKLFRTALLALPGEQKILKGLYAMESLAGLQDQYSVNWGIGSADLSGILILLINLFLVMLAWYLKKSKLSRFLAVATLFFIILGTGGALLAMNRMNRLPQGVVKSEGAALSRIPEETADEWLLLPPGTSFRLITEKKDYYFIKTGYGLEGWLPRGKVVPVTDEAF